MARILHYPVLRLTVLAGLVFGTVAGFTDKSLGTTTLGLRKIRDAVIYQERQFHATFPSVTAISDSEVLCAFRRAPSRRALYGAAGDPHTDANSYLVNVRSTDGGETFTTSPEMLYAHHFGGSQDPCLFHLNDGSLLCFSYGWAPLTDGEMKAQSNNLKAGNFGFLGGYLLESNDKGHTWDGPIYPAALPSNQTVNAYGEPLSAYNRGALVQLADGTILWAVARHDQLSPFKSSVQLMRSNDGGHTWQPGPDIATNEKISFNETSLVQAANGDIIAFLRTDDKEMKAATARSRDGGKTFEPWQWTEWSGLPLQAIRLRDDRLLLVYGYRQKPYGIRARLLSPDASDVKTAPEFIIRDDGKSGDLGYPWAVELANGNVLVVYYMDTGDGTRHIAGSWLTVERQPDSVK